MNYKYYIKKYNYIFTIIIITIIVAIISFTIGKNNPRDTTDSPEERSGMRLHTDHKTGCQYLSPVFGRLTPRMDKTGKQLCGESDE